MAGITGLLANSLVSMLESPSEGVNIRVGAIVSADSTLEVIGIRSVIAANASIDLSEKAGQMNYPMLMVYCARLSNTMQEKFREFSGSAQMVVEVRHSQSQLSGMETNLQVYVDAVCALLDDSRGDWGSGIFYAGGYDVSYEPVVQGGRNYLQRARIGFDVEVSR